MSYGEHSEYDTETKATSYTVSKVWTLESAVALCKKIEAFAPQYGYHIGLTGGSLYKDGPRKDMDLIVYPHNDPKNVPDQEGFEDALLHLGIFVESKHYGWLKKAKLDFKNIDIFYMMRDRKDVPNNHETEYPVQDNVHTIEVDFGP